MGTIRARWRAHARSPDGAMAVELVRITPIDNPRGLRVEGEVDWQNACELERALAEALEWGGDVWLDLSQLRFIDVAGLGLIAQAASRLPAGRRLVLHGASPLVRKVLAIFSWDASPKLHVQ